MTLQTIPLLRAENLSFSYRSFGRRKEILHDISFSLLPGSCTALLGNNGCGKSTLLSILSGVQKAENGQLFFVGKPLTASVISASVGYVPQGNPLVEDLNARDNLLLRFKGSKKALSNKLSVPPVSLLDPLPLLDLRVSKMSGGMKRRLSLACAFLNDPALLILDEPCSALDFSMKERMHICLSSYRESGGTILLSTHEESDLSLCDSLLLLKDGVLSVLSPSLRGDALHALFRENQSKEVSLCVPD